MPRKPDVPCASCGRLMWRGRGSRPPGEAVCRPCRKTGVARTHGRSGYKHGCRCPDCRDAHRVGMADYVERHKSRHGLTPTEKYRGVPKKRVCASCGGPCRKVGDTPFPRCRKCTDDEKGRWISDADRSAIYERDDWICQLCFEPVAPSEASLDHIEPRSWALIPDHSPNNLRLAHRACNSARGNRAS